MSITEEQVNRILDTVKHSSTGMSILSIARVTKVAASDGSLGVILEFKADIDRDTLRTLRDAAEDALKKEFSSHDVSCVASRTPHAPTEKQSPHAQQAQGAKGPPPTMPGRPKAPEPEAIPGVRHIVAVASGKGGVGKSTTTLNLAMALRDQGLKVGIVDCDIFGPSQPHLLGNKEKPTTKDGKLVPIEAHGMKTMSVGYLIEVDHAVVWRGPRVMGATKQMLKDVNWGELDVLMVDLPPGTGDVQLTMVQQVVLSGAIIVSTPQDLALIDARKGISMFKQTGTKILGLIENMSIFCCPNCGTETAIFGTGGAKETASKIGVPFLGALPLAPKIREYADAGTPLLSVLPDSAEAALYRDVATGVSKALNLNAAH